jgi:hypothetical protein
MRQVEPSSRARTEDCSLADQVSKFRGDIGARTGSILASWFLFNSDGPTAYAFGYIEEGRRLRFFCRWMHFSGGEIYVLNAVSASEGASANFGELTMNALIGLTNHMAMTGGNGLGTSTLPSFVKTNGNAEIGKCLKYLIAHGPAAHSTDWGRELYYLNNYGIGRFGRIAEETRETYKQLLNQDETEAYQSQPFSEAAFDEW